MNDFFANFYELDLVYHSIFSPVLWENDAYTNFGLLMIIGPLFFLAIFYLLITFPKCNKWHWFIALVLGIGAVGIISSNLLNYELATFVYNDGDGIREFILNMILLNIGYAVLWGLLLSIVPQLIIPNKPQSHLPFLLKNR